MRAFKWHHSCLVITLKLVTVKFIDEHINAEYHANLVVMFNLKRIKVTAVLQ